MRYIITRPTVESDCGFRDLVTWKVSMRKYGRLETQITAFAVSTLHSSCGNVLLLMGCCLQRAINF